MHRLAGPRWKVKVAREHIDALNFQSQRFFNRNIGRARLGKSDPQSRQTQLHPIGGPVESPPEWSVRVGEVVHDLRSALDHLICQLAWLRDNKRTYRFCESSRTQFPIYLYGPRAVRQAKRDRFDRKRLNYLRPQDAALIGRLQPYKRRNGQRRAALWLLHELSNADKHNIIILVDEWRLRPPTVTVVKGSTLKGETRPDPVERGYMQMEFEPAAQIAFGEGCDAVKGFPVIRTLSRLADAVDYIIESFAADFS